MTNFDSTKTFFLAESASKLITTYLWTPGGKKEKEEKKPIKTVKGEKSYRNWVAIFKRFKMFFFLTEIFSNCT